MARSVVPLAVAVAVWWAPSLPIRINLTPSLPRGLYLVAGEAPAVGRLAAACLPADVAKFGLRRGYLRPGDCPGDASPVMKQVVAGEGDHVAIGDGDITVNGQPLATSAARPHDRAGRLMRPQPTGARTLGAGELWLYAPRADSWDSRYWGPVHSSSVLTTLRPLATWPRTIRGTPPEGDLRKDGPAA